MTAFFCARQYFVQLQYEPFKRFVKFTSTPIFWFSIFASLPGLKHKDLQERKFFVLLKQMKQSALWQNRGTGKSRTHQYKFA